jgi:ABC-type sugar transport system ATPase subunit
VVLVEELGAEELVHLRLEPAPDTDTAGSEPRLVVRTAGASRMAPGDTTHVTVDPHRFHFFAPDTGQTLGAVSHDLAVT